VADILEWRGVGEKKWRKSEEEEGKGRGKGRRERRM